MSSHTWHLLIPLRSKDFLSTKTPVLLRRGLDVVKLVFKEGFPFCKGEKQSCKVKKKASRILSSLITKRFPYNDKNSRTRNLTKLKKRLERPCHFNNDAITFPACKTYSIFSCFLLEELYDGSDLQQKQSVYNCHESSVRSWIPPQYTIVLSMNKG